MEFFQRMNLVTDKIQLSHSGQYDILGLESIISICWINSKKKQKTQYNELLVSLKVEIIFYNVKKFKNQKREMEIILKHLVKTLYLD